MGTVFIICFACLFLIPGLLIALLNWANISIWVWEKWQNPRSKAETCIAPFLGGLLLTSGIGILGCALPEYFVPILKPVAAWAGHPGVAAVVALTGFLIDYGSVPNLIITPLLDFLFGLRNAPKVTTPRGPYCRELQLSFPLLLVGEDEIPRLICNPAGLPERDADFLQEAPELLKLLKSCTVFTELLTLGCLAGWWENTTPDNGLPSLNEESITEEDIRRAAAAVVFGK